MMEKRKKKKNPVKEKLKKLSYTKQSKKKGNTKKKKNMFLNILLVGVITFIILISLFFAFIVVKAPKFDPNNLKFTQMTELYDTDGNIFAKLGNENRTEITYDELPEVLVDAIVATEDSRFFQHNGFDLPRFLKASFGQVLGKDAGGASTLTMQIVKNNYTDAKAVSGVKGILRKFTDIYLSIFKVEKKYTKKEIIEFYVNDSYLGNGAYGVEQASKNYFGKSVKDLNLAEASFIAGLFQSPVYYNPYNYPERAEKRRQVVLYLMQRHGYITREEKEIASSKPITHFIKEKQASSDYKEYQDYIETVIEELDNEYDLSPYTTPLRIYTSMNKSKQDFVNKVMRGEAWKWENDKVQAGVVMTTSETGEVIAVGAGRNRDSQMSFNYATQTNRHIGSTAKPIFAYGPAVEYLGWGTTTYIKDEPHTYTGGKKINNSDGGYKGILPMYKALGLSRNITALKAFQETAKNAGNGKIVQFATGLGLTPEIESGKIHEAHSIGSFVGSKKKGESRNSPMTMAGAYQAFSNGGYYIKPHTIRKITFKDNDEVIESKFNKTRVMQDSTAYIITNALNWSVTSGLARSAANIGGVSVAAKTGTSNFDDDTIRKNGLSRRAINDLWVCGYTPSQTITFWYGYDKIYKDHYNTTSNWSTRDRFFRNLAQNLFDKTGAQFKVPSSIKTVNVLKNSMPNKIAGANTPVDMVEVGYYKKGTEPKEESKSYNKLPSVRDLNGKITNGNVKLTWKGITAEQLLDIETQETFGALGYDIYIKDGEKGTEKFIGTTTNTSFTHKTDLENPIYVVYSAFANYKDNKSNGVSFKLNNKKSFDVKVKDETINLNDVFNDIIPIIVLYNSVDVTNEADIKFVSGTVDTSKAGEYKLKYKVTYDGITKEVTRTVTVKDNNETENVG